MVGRKARTFGLNDDADGDLQIGKHRVHTAVADAHSVAVPVLEAQSDAEFSIRVSGEQRAVDVDERSRQMQPGESLGDLQLGCFSS